MKPVMQTKFGATEGNCFKACVASVLELGIDDVPDFCVPGKNWLRLFEEWLKPRGFGPLVVYAGQIIPSGIHYLVGGLALTRNILHSVVYFDGEMVHDPHPDGSGLDPDYKKDYTYFIPLDYTTSVKLLAALKHAAVLHDTLNDIVENITRIPDSESAYVPRILINAAARVVGDGPKGRTPVIERLISHYRETRRIISLPGVLNLLDVDRVSLLDMMDKLANEAEYGGD